MANEAREGVSCGPPRTITAEEGDLIPHMSAQKEANGPVIIRVAAAYLSRSINSIESQSFMAMIREDFEALNEARDAVNEAREKLFSTYDFVNDKLTEAHEAAIRARVRVTLCTDDHASEETVQAIDDALAELGYSTSRLTLSSGVFLTRSEVTYGAAPSWIVSELAGVVRDHQQTPTAIPVNEAWDDDDWDVFVDVVTSTSTDEHDDEDDVDEDDEPAGFQGLGSLFG